MTKSKQCMEKAATYRLLYIKYAAEYVTENVTAYASVKCGLNAVNYV